MTTFTIEIDEMLLARAEAATRERGSDLQKAIVESIEEIVSERPSRQLEAVRRMIARADANPRFFEGGIPNRDERNAR